MKLPEKIYIVLKYACLVFLPALATFIIAMGEIWQLSNCQQIAATVTALAALLGGLIGASSAEYYKNKQTEEEEK